MSDFMVRGSASDLTSGGRGSRQLGANSILSDSDAAKLYISGQFGRLFDEFGAFGQVKSFPNIFFHQLIEKSRSGPTYDGETL